MSNNVVFVAGEAALPLFQEQIQNMACKKSIAACVWVSVGAGLCKIHA
jgi:hypothetical protein